MFNVGQQVSGKVAGRFVILAFRTVGGIEMAQVKPVGPNGQLGRGEFALPLTALVA